MLCFVLGFIVEHACGLCCRFHILPFRGSSFSICEFDLLDSAVSEFKHGLQVFLFQVVSFTNMFSG